MRGIKIFYPICWAAMALVFHVMSASGAFSVIALNFFLLLAAPAGFIYRRRTAFFIAAASSVIIPPALIFAYKLDLSAAFSSIAFFDILIAGSVMYRSMIEKKKWGYVRKLKDMDEEAKRQSIDLAELARNENSIREKEIAVVKLYEMTKRMSGAMRLDEILAVLGEVLRGNFKFSRGELILFKGPGASAAPGRSYRIPGGTNELSGAVGMDHEYIVRALSEKKAEIFFDMDSDAAAFRALRAGPGAMTAAALPLAGENRMLGAIVVEDVNRADLEKIVIIAMQFALEIKKVFLYEKIEDLAITDGLTGLFVRRYFMERLEEEISRSKRYGYSFAFLMIDIDNFKKCNDTYGHLVGDVVLRGVARIIKERVREIDLVGRFGGEEFSVALPETGIEGAAMAADRVRKDIEKNIFRAYDEKLKLTVSIGVAVYPHDSDNARDLIDKADQALYAAKKSGKNIVCEYKR